MLGQRCDIVMLETPTASSLNLQRRDSDQSDVTSAKREIVTNWGESDVKELLLRGEHAVNHSFF